MKYRLYPKAKDFLAKLLKYYEDKNPQAGVSIYKSIHKTIKSICFKPRIGEEVVLDIREFPETKYKHNIYYVIDEDKKEIQILMILASRMNTDEIIKGLLKYDNVKK